MSFDHIFNKLDIEADPFVLCELHGKCDMKIGRRAGAMLHYVLSGRGEIIIQDHPPFEVCRGSLVLVPALQSHTLRSYGETGQPIPDCHPAELNLAQHLLKGVQPKSGGKLLAICSRVNVGLRGVENLIDLVREPLVEMIEKDSPMVASVEQLLQELSTPTLGSRALIRVLLLQCMIYLLRKRLLAHDPALNWMAALTDERLWNALFDARQAKPPSWLRKSCKCSRDEPFIIRGTVFRRLR